MNPQQDQTPSLPLPHPSFDSGAGSAPMSAVSGYQQAPSMPPMGQASMPAVPAPPAALPNMSHPQSPAMPTPIEPSLVAAQAPAMPAGGGEDENALDQEWVAKARGIVARTHSDPYLQSKELSKIKAQYIKARYNKDIKTVDD